MPDATTLVVFATASLALYLSPGPDMLYIASRSMAGGVRAGIWSALGVTAGLVVHMLAAAFGLAAVLTAWPVAATVIQWAGAAYLMWLGWGLLTGRGSDRETPTGAAASDPWRLFRQGLLVNLANPKIALFFLAFLPQFIDPAAGDATTQLLLFGGLFNAGGLVWVLIQAAIFGRLGAWLFRHPGAQRWQRRVSGGVLVGLAGHLAFGGR